MEFFVNLPVAGINTTIADHFVMLFRDMPDKTFYKIHNRDGFFHVFVIFVTIVMEGNKVTVIVVDSGRGNDRAAKVTPNVFYSCFRVAFVWFCIDIKAFFVVTVAGSLRFFKRRIKLCFHLVQKGGAESVTEISVVKIIDIAPEPVIAVATFRNKAVDVRVPFQVSAEGMEDHDKARSEVHGLILLKKHTGDNAVHRMEQTVEQGTVTHEEITEVFINGEYTVTVRDIHQFKGHGSGALHGVEVSTSWAETAVAAKRDEFQLTAVETAIHCPAKRRITAVDHFIHVLNDRLTWM